ncbi:flagellar hook-associated protein FlgK [Sphingomonas sp. 2R-10]|uniref:flagellar hook-associated protein FlgK n=1 Tax=Sphingomonas sp. 2R-10 TaxID=3045148 RepID=UPI000F7914B4|nr:flagellar hook-associated protein FlgK [Sphingomonas sp. 2R-10]MDJ0276543.1 flagellar hook-associated protein FlgK [Sphingomonas sp. 2R-10]
MSDLLSIGASGVRAYQSALTTTSDNIANAGTTGYVRRTTSLAEIGVGSSRQTTGSGVIVAGIARAADMFRSAEVRQSSSDVARSDGGIVWLERIEDALSSRALTTRMTAFFNTATTLSADPSADAPRRAMLESAESVAQSYSGTVGALDAASNNLDLTANNAVAKLSNGAAVLARINDGLARVSRGSTGEAQLLDQRDRMLDEMSELTDLDVRFDTVGRVTVRAGGADGPLMVHGIEASVVRYGRDDANMPVFTTMRGGLESVLTPRGGGLAGMVDGAQRINAMRGEVVALATAFVNGVNGAFEAGEDANGDPGTAMFAIDADGRVTRAMDDPKKIAAAALGKGARDSGNLSVLADARRVGAFEAKAVALQSTNGSALASRKTIAEAQGAIRDSAVDARDASAGVNLDQEAVNLMKFQQAYQASSRVIQVARETFDALMAIR